MTKYGAQVKQMEHERVVEKERNRVKTSEGAKDRAERSRIETNRIAHEVTENAKKRRHESKENEMNRKTQKEIAAANAASKAASDVIGGIIKAGVAAAANDPTWYKQFIKDSSPITNLPQFWPLGTEVDLGLLDGKQQSIAGILVYEYMQTLGAQSSNYLKSAINVAIGNVTAMLRRTNSRIGSYDPADIGTYLFHVAITASHLINAGVILKAATSFDKYNLYIGSGVVAAKGFGSDFVNIRNRRAEFIFRLNALIKRFNTSLPLPQISLAARYSFLNNLVIKDASVKNSQLYIFRPAYYSSWSDASNMITLTPVPSTFDAYLTALEDAVSQFLNDADMIVLMSDIRQGMQDKFYTVSEVGLDETLTVAESDEVLSQINNIEVALAPIWPQSRIIRQNPDGILVQGYDPLEPGGTDYLGGIVLSSDGTSPYISSGVEAALDDTNTHPVGLNFYHEDVTADDILVASRFKLRYDKASSSGGTVGYVAACGSEIVTKLYILTKDANQAHVYTETAIYQLWAFNGTSVPLAQINQIALMAKFDWAPYLKVIFTGTPGEPNVI